VPTYQYACTACGHRLEAVQSFTDASLTECPECSGKLRKLFGSVGVVFKGSGFYRNDSRAEADGNAKKKAAPVESKSGDSGSKSSDSGSKAGGSGAKSGDGGSKSSSSAGSSSSSGGSSSSSSKSSSSGSSSSGSSSSGAAAAAS
jgi:putative FmdB family regulatory protein